MPHIAGGIKRNCGWSLFHAGWEVKRWSRYAGKLVEVSARLVPRTVPIHRALTLEGRATPRVTAFVAPLFASAVYTVREAGLFPPLVPHIENLVVKDDREQVLRQFIINRLEQMVLFQSQRSLTALQIKHGQIVVRFSIFRF